MRGPQGQGRQAALSRLCTKEMCSVICSGGGWLSARRARDRGAWYWTWVLG